MTAFADFAALKAAVTNYAIRTGDTAFAAQLPVFAAMAEARIYDGSGGTMPSDPLRVPELETAESNAALTDGTGTLPATFLSVRRIRWDGSPKTVPDYEAPSVFWANRYTATSCSPVSYTVEGDKIHVSPMVTGNLKVTYYARPQALANDADTNDILTTYPALYLHSMLIEAGIYMRDREFIADHYQAYVSALDGIMKTARRKRMGAGRLAIRIPGARV